MLVFLDIQFKISQGDMNGLNIYIYCNIDNCSELLTCTLGQVQGIYHAMKLRISFMSDQGRWIYVKLIMPPYIRRQRGFQ